MLAKSIIYEKNIILSNELRRIGNRESSAMSLAQFIEFPVQLISIIICGRKRFDFPTDH